MCIIGILLLGLLLQEDSPEALYSRGVAAYNEGRYADAVEALERAAALRSDAPDYRFHLGLAYLKTGQAREAARELEATLGMAGLRRETRLKEPLVLVQAAIAYLHLGNVKTARARAELALKKSEPTADIEYILGLVANAEGDEEEALARFAAAVELDRDHREANLALAGVLSSRGQREEALDALRHATHRDDGTFEVYMALGELSFENGDVDGAGEAFAYALEARPDDPAARYNLGTIRLAQARYSEAIELFGSLSEPRAAFHLGEAYRLSGALDEAARVFGELLAGEETPFELETRLALALVQEGLEQQDAAEASYRAILEEHPDELRALLNLAALVEGLGRLDEAIPLLEHAFEVAAPEDRERIAAALTLLQEAR